jgi:CRISPR-associated protein Cmr3
VSHWYFIEPCDVWMFRDSKPFTAGQSFVARSQFPPTPQTMQGVVRSNYLETQNVNWQAYGKGKINTAVGTPSELGDFSQIGPLVGQQTNAGIAMLMPAPLDVVRSKSGDQTPLLLAPQATAGHVRTSAPFAGWRPLAPASRVDDLTYAGGWLDEAGIKAYLKGQAPSSWVESSALFVHEERVGLALASGKRTAREHHLYHAQYVRPQPGVGLLVGTNDAYLPNDAVINIGGESRSGYCTAVDFTPLSGATSGRIKLVLLTPAYFSGGSGPADGDWSRWVGGGRLVSTAIGRPQPISGWDVANNRPKPLNQYVPAGSVFYFEDAEWQGVPFTETPEGMLDHGAIGFGGALTATWNSAN